MQPEDLRFSEEHEWVRVDGDAVVVGISDYAQEELGDITFIELPKVDTDLARMANLAVIESVKAASDIFAPVSGTVTAVNRDLEDTPEMINTSPYDEGWICRIRMKDPKELEKLMDTAAYESYTKGLGD